jgi:inward rectifier potassium channel
MSRGVRVQLGEYQGIKLGVHAFSLKDPYYTVLTVRWPVFFSLAVTFYLSLNLLFASAYYLVPGCINNARPGVFTDCFFFSIETLATVGYGVMSPATLYGHIVASTEIITGMMSMAVITGLVFVRFSRPRARMLFSKVAVVAPFDGRTALMFRVASQRNGAVADASARFTMLRAVKDGGDGHIQRRFIDLKLERSTSPMLGLSWTLVHYIDEDSPLHGATPEMLEKEGSSLLVSISGYDESISANVTARHTYRPGALLYGHRFVNIIEYLPTGEIELDMRHFHDVVELPETGLRAAA